jgi:hypothetical protein
MTKEKEKTKKTKESSKGRMETRERREQGGAVENKILRTDCGFGHLTLLQGAGPFGWRLGTAFPI